jgi:thioredoxin 1
MSNLIHSNDINFDKDVIESDKPVLVDFGATWCSPCKQQLPILEQFAELHKDEIKVVSLDTDESPIVTAKFNVKGVPALLLFKEGRKVGSKVGLTSKAGLEKFLTESL